MVAGSRGEVLRWSIYSPYRKKSEFESMKISLLEQHTLQAVIGLHPNAYGVSIQDRIEQAGCKFSIGSIYAALERLEEKGFVKFREGEPTPERGGRRKLYVIITAPGQKALQESLSVTDSLRAWVSA
jgi:DNA-binding PadR family transcriptional regulator